MIQYKYIAVEGCIGAGKTTLATKIAEKLGGNLVLEEFASNTFLEKFYANMERYAFPLEVSFLVERFQQLSVQLPEGGLFNRFAISDYFLDKSLIFARLNLRDDQYHLLRGLFENLQQQIPRPDLIIYLYNDLERLKKNIAIRGRQFEQQIPSNYLLQLQDMYVDYLKKITDQRILLLDATSVDFVEKEEDFENILSLLQQEHKKGITRV